MNKHIIILFYSFFCIFSSSCQKIELMIPDSPSNSAELFDAFWNKMNTNYVYWDIDSTNWDNIYNDYKSLFADLDLKNEVDLQLVVQYFQEMTIKLIDCHYNIVFSDSLIPDYIIFPSLDKKKKRKNFHQKHNYFILDIKYLDKDFRLGTYYTQNNSQLRVLSGVIDNRILFFSCNEFYLYEAYHSNTKNSVKQVLDFFFNKLHNLPDGIQGIIIDLRGNQGGDIGDLNFFVGHFIEQQLHYGYIQTKNGNGRLDYTPWINAYVNPQLNGKKIDLPIVLLTDMYTASLAEAVLFAFKTFSQYNVVGETTWGATGPLVNYDVYNAGKFTVGKYLTVNTSSCKFKYLDGIIYEGVGIKPDISIPYDNDLLINGRDIQLEKAISIFN